jgi:hypothetical protein
MRRTAVLVIFIVASAGTEPLSEREKADGFLPIFNGKDLQGWKLFESKPEGWAVEKGVLVNTGKGGGWLGTEREHANFILRLDYRMSAGSNSGVYLRAPEKGHISRVGMEIQLLDDPHPRFAKVNRYQNTGAIYHVVGPSELAGRPAGEWNTLEIRADGRRVAIVLNGKKVVDANLDDYLSDPAIAKEHTGLKRTAGHIGLQSHNDRVEFRNIRLKELK